MGARSSYQYDPAYRWLKGKLEYSRADRTWKLRYIPITGETDKFGGSVILEDSPKLDGFQAGDVVTVQGALGREDLDHAGFAPIYHIDHVVADR